jgi:hypothetical protein
MANAIKIAAYDTLGLNKTYKVIENGVTLGVVSKTVDHRVNARDQRVSVTTWSFACPFGHCDGYRTREEAISGMFDMIEGSDEITVYEDDLVRTPKKVDVHFYKECTGSFPRGANCWAFSIVGTAGSTIKLMSDCMNITAAEKVIVEYVKQNARKLVEACGSLVAIRLCA